MCFDRLAGLRTPGFGQQNEGHNIFTDRLLVNDVFGAQELCHRMNEHWPDAIALIFFYCIKSYGARWQLSPGWLNKKAIPKRFEYLQTLFFCHVEDFAMLF